MPSARLVIQSPDGVCTDAFRRGPSNRPPTICTIVRVPCGPFSTTVRVPVSARSRPRYSKTGARGVGMALSFLEASALGTLVEVWAREDGPQIVVPRQISKVVRARIGPPLLEG